MNNLNKIQQKNLYTQFVDGGLSFHRTSLTWNLRGQNISTGKIRMVASIVTFINHQLSNLSGKKSSAVRIYSIIFCIMPWGLIEISHCVDRALTGKGSLPPNPIRKKKIIYHHVISRISLKLTWENSYWTILFKRESASP